MSSQRATNVAVIGAGIAGMGAAHALLKAGVQVSLFDRECHVGGDAYSVPVHAPDGSIHMVDGGLCDYDRVTSKSFDGFLAELGVDRRLIAPETSFHQMDANGELTALYTIADDSTLTVLAALPDEVGIRCEYARFRASVHEVLTDRALAEMTLGAYLKHRQYSEAFAQLFVLPWALACQALHERPVRDFSMRALAAVWAMQNSFGGVPSQRTIIVGGMSAFCRKFAGSFQQRGGRLRLGSDVFSVRRTEGGVVVRWMGEDGPHTARFDQVILAITPPNLSAVIEDADAGESEFFAAVPLRRDQIVVHTDAALLPRARQAWGAFNFLVPKGGDDRGQKPTVTVWQNRLRALDERVPDVFVTVNPHIEPARHTVIAAHMTSQPVGGLGALWGQGEWDGIQGADRLWYCGGYMQMPFLQENAYQSGMGIAARLLQAADRAQADAGRGLVA